MVLFVVGEAGTGKTKAAMQIQLDIPRFSVIDCSTHVILPRLVRWTKRKYGSELIEFCESVDVDPELFPEKPEGLSKLFVERKEELRPLWTHIAREWRKDNPDAVINKALELAKNREKSGRWPIIVGPRGVDLPRIELLKPREYRMLHITAPLEVRLERLKKGAKFANQVGSYEEYLMRDLRAFRQRNRGKVNVLTVRNASDKSSKLHASLENLYPALKVGFRL